MKYVTSWIESIVHPDGYQIWAVVLSFGVVVGLSHWHDVWLDPRVHGWFERQNDFVKLGVYGIGCLAVFVVFSFVISAVVEKVGTKSSCE